MVYCPREGAELEASSGMVDRYSIIERRGEGAMGVVYKAHHLHLQDRQVALKMLYRELARDPLIVDRFFREAKAASSIANVHIVKVLDFGKSSEGDSFLVMEYLEGSSLREVLEAEQILPLKRAFTICLQIARALQAAHDKGIVHRDLKPGNIMLVGESGQEVVKLLDFGIAQLSEFKENRLTREGIVLGTPAYMSPEQASGQGVDHRTDIYALGTILYEILTGRCPFEGETAKEVLLAKITQNPTPPRQIRPEIPLAVEAVILHVLHKDQDVRPQTIQDLVPELEDALLQTSGTVPLITPPRSIPAYPAEAEPEEEEETLVPVSGLPWKKRRSRGWYPFAGMGAGLLIGVLFTVLVMTSGADKEEDAQATGSDLAIPQATKDVVPLRPDVDTAAPSPTKVTPSIVKKENNASGQRLPRARNKRPASRAPTRRASVRPRKKSAPPKGKWQAMIRTTPAGAEVSRRGRTLGTSPLKVSTSKQQTLLLERLGFQGHKLTIPARSTKTYRVRLKKSTMSWEVLSLSQLKKMREKGQISRFTYRRRRQDLNKKMERKLMDLKIKYKIGQYSKQEYERLVKAVKASYR